MVIALLRRYPNQQFYLFADQKIANALKCESNLRICGSFKFFLSRCIGKISKKLLRRINDGKTAKCDAAVRIGGSVFIERDNASQTYFPEKHSRYFYIGANFGPYYSEKFFETRKSRICAAQDCCFRDLYSYNLFKELNSVRYAPDVLFGYKYLPPTRKGDSIGISVIDFKSRSELADDSKTYVEGITAICDYWTNKGKTVKLLSFCRDEGDEAASAEISKACAHPKQVQLINYHGDVDLFINELNNCETIYATRFHAMVLGWTMEKNVIPIIYSDKQTRVIEDLKFGGDVWNILKGEQISERHLLSQNGRLTKPDIERLRENADAQFYGLDKLIDEMSR